ncbi:MAG TPA: hypothetical protein VFV40_02805, partial [Nocardioides sp.]|nr:hypothetical protein [Nocardioides sp.]
MLESDPDAAEGTSPTAHDLLVRMRRLQIRANVAEMARARTMTAMFQQFGSDVKARRAEDPHFTANPLTETVVETQPVTGQTPGRIRSEIETVLIVDQHLPWLAEHLDSGRLDLYRAKPVIDAFTDDLGDHPEARRRFAELMQRWFARAAEVSTDLLNKTITQIRNHTHYVVTKVLAGEFDDRFKRRHRRRNVHTQATGDGMGSLTIDTDLVSVRLAEHRLDTLAREARAAGDERTLEQLRADLAIDLLTGRAAVGEGHREHVAGRWARPVVNVTVPVQTLMGLSDEPGRMGDQTLPASLVRHVAAQPESTWYRLLTDGSRGVELSTEAYRPTAAIWREVVARQPTCFAPTCDRPATECELDHAVPYPAGDTSTENLGPACARHHRSKHALGASLRRGADGQLRYTTRAGLTHLVSPAEQPVTEDGRSAEIWAALVETAPTTTELAEALDTIRLHHTRATTTVDMEARHRARTEDAYRRSYPDATQEDLDRWVWDPDAEAPPLVR